MASNSFKQKGIICSVCTWRTEQRGMSLNSVKRRLEKLCNGNESEELEWAAWGGGEVFVTAMRMAEWHR